MRGEEYTEDDLERIRRGIESGLTYAEIAEQFPNRTPNAVRNRVRRMEIQFHRPPKITSEKAQRDALRRAEREAERERENSFEGQDAAFQAAMRKAIAAGLEHVDEGVSLVPCTEYPVLVRPFAIQFSRSPSLMCAETGDA